MTQAPEYTFNCQTAVLSAAFHTFDPHLVLGGTYSGQVCYVCDAVAAWCCELARDPHSRCVPAPQMVMWDYRAKGHPVQQTPLSATGHTHPVYRCVLLLWVPYVRTLANRTPNRQRNCVVSTSLAIVGASNAHSLVSVSTDGRMCLWNTTKLVEPVVRACVPGAGCSATVSRPLNTCAARSGPWTCSQRARPRKTWASKGPLAHRGQRRVFQSQQCPAQLESNGSPLWAAKPGHWASASCMTGAIGACCGVCVVLVGRPCGRSVAFKPRLCASTATEAPWRCTLGTLRIKAPSLRCSTWHLPHPRGGGDAGHSRRVHGCAAITQPSATCCCHRRWTGA